MLDLKFIRENPDRVRRGIEAKGAKVDLDRLLTLDQERRKLIQEVESLKKERNLANDQIAQKKAQKAPVDDLLSSMKTISQKIEEIDKQVGDKDKLICSINTYIPNIPYETVTVSKDPTGNKVVRKWGEPKKFGFNPLTHEELGKKLGWLSFERGSKVTGSAFPVYEGKGARLERGLINFMVDLHAKKHGYEEVWVPHLVNRASMFGTGQLPKMEEDMYKLKEDDYFLIPTAEVPVTNLFRDEILSEKELPKKRVSYTPCFRREAGSYGKETKGLARVHQFDKVELVKIVKPDQGLNELESLVKDAEEVLQLLEIPYRVVELCSVELSFAGAKGYDLEAWAPASERWFEVSSCTWFGDFQARRMNIRFKPAGGQKSEFVHTLNGSGVALARTVLCLLENCQTSKGEVEFPKALKPYLD
ncbi:MAG: serine--tRNA ligase [Candidatus Omnitrophica bacterium]|nr:serine--tRNA ligase [Candidatus Omnitrophota bacterium]